MKPSDKEGILDLQSAIVAEAELGLSRAEAVSALVENWVRLMRQLGEEGDSTRRRQLSEEASLIYAPMAHKIGLYQMKSELEDLSLKYLEHDAYYHIKEKLNETKASREAYMARFIEPVAQALTKAGLSFRIKGRTKSIHSIWQKMKKQGVDVDGVYDLFAIRIILDAEPKREKEACWQTYALITDMWESNPKRMRDWISAPKPNGYECLHITVLGPEERWVEVQIRTERMDDIAEHGLAAHWRYKGVGANQGAISEGDLRTEDSVFAFTPKGDLMKLPEGATVLDFAFAIHTRIGMHCSGAKIGGRIVSIRHRLTSGDRVSILTQAQQLPKQDWLSACATSKARTKIRQALKEAEAGQAQMAREELERKLRNRKIEFSEATLMHTITRLGYKVVTDFYKALADGTLDTNRAIEAYQAQLLHDRHEEPPTPTTSATIADGYVSPSVRHATGDGIVIGREVKGVEWRLAKCCRPIHGDTVFGFVSLSGAISIHRTDCPNAPQMRQRYAYRIVEATWAGEAQGQYAATLHIVGNDDVGIVANITSLISKEANMQMRDISVSAADGLFAGQLTVMIADNARLSLLIKKLRTIKGIKSVTR